MLICNTEIIKIFEISFSDFHILFIVILHSLGNHKTTIVEKTIIKVIN